ncbi:MAG TPA: T9SS type A sorting domain-containing protein [Bacteroidales bacterium]|nr:T9SS type A sorting domain-containing protein [Bacteroidales bacterium]
MKKFYPFLLVLATPVVLLLMSNNNGSPGGKSGSIGDGGATCTQCHTGGSATTVSGWITTNVPAEGYTPGQTYTITATGTHTGVVKFGFELTVESSTGAKVGTLQLTEPTRTKFTNANQAVTHTAAGNVPSGNTNSWTMNWVAPTGVQGNIGIYAAFNAANGNGNNSGDVIYKSSTFISQYVPPPTLVSIVPDEAEQGQTVQTTITGSNTQFSGSPSVSLSFSNNPNETISASNVVVVNATVIQAQFAVPGNASVGLWDLHVNLLSLDNAFTVIQAEPSIVFMEPNFAYQGDSFTGTIYGENTTWSGTPSVTLTHVNNPNEIITGTNVTVVSPTQLTADFAIAEAGVIGNYNVNVDDLMQAAGFTVLAALVPEIAGISPVEGEQGTMVTTTITAENTDFGQPAPVVSLTLHGNPGESIPATSVTVINGTTLEADFDIPYEATPGLYDLQVDDLTLVNAFTVIDVVPFLVSISPNTADQGETVVTTITAADSRFTLDEPSVSLSFSGDPLETIAASGVTVISNFVVEAEFIIPSNASVGTWDVHADEMTLSGAFTIDQAIGIADNLAGMIRIYPNPADQKFFVENSRGAEITIFRTSGEQVLSLVAGNIRQEVNIETLTQGLYLVNIRMNGMVKTEKLLVK